MRMRIGYMKPLIYLFIYLFVCLFIYIFNYLFIYLFIFCNKSATDHQLIFVFFSLQENKVKEKIRGILTIKLRALSLHNVVRNSIREVVMTSVLDEDPSCLVVGGLYKTPSI